MLAIVRLPRIWMPLIDANPALKHIPKLFTGQEPLDLCKKTCSGKTWTVHHHKVTNLKHVRVYQEILALFRQYKVSHALVTQRLLWYSQLVGQVCKELGIQLTWCECFFDDRIIMDRLALQYCKDNDIKYEVIGPLEPPLLPKKTRQPQPATLAPEELRAKLGVTDPANTVVVLGQTYYDMAVVEFPWLNYGRWLEALFKANPKTQFLFKHHPQKATPLIETYKNVRVINESLESLWGAFDLFASFSSTTIFEGMIHGKKFATGGYHFCSGVSMPVHAPEEATNLVERLKAYTIPTDAWNRRLFFICNRYTVPLVSPHLWERMNKPSKQYFEEYK
jgi:hypothetical protein